MHTRHKCTAITHTTTSQCIHIQELQPLSPVEVHQDLIDFARGFYEAHDESGNEEDHAEEIHQKDDRLGGGVGLEQVRQAVSERLCV